ncbi:MAG TPA: putative 2OG-Fe(II) oxygenase, partial [Lysobacter sp.]|nr:putative 2OG-Fe(II) oxygenase [Lysobacter sp.]
GLALAAAGNPDAAVDFIGLQRHVRAIALPIPAGFADADSYHADLANDIRHHSQQRWEPVGLAARNAYLGGDLLADRTPAIVGFEQRLREAIDAFLATCRAQHAAGAGDVFLDNIPRDYRMHVWATQAAQSGYIDTHIHEDSWLSGAYYVEVPAAIRADDPTHAGWIEFGRPYATLPPWPDRALRHVLPQVGTLLLFPSYLFHRTLPYTGGGERISISFDLAAA